jgi:hypothetical protein
LQHACNARSQSSRRIVGSGFAVRLAAKRTIWKNM